MAFFVVFAVYGLVREELTLAWFEHYYLDVTHCDGFFGTGFLSGR